MNLDIKLLTHRFSHAKEGEPVSTAEVSPYLLEHVIRPLMRGEKVRYGDIDYDQFEDVDLRVASGYCEDIYCVARKLEQFVGDISNTESAARRTRVFC